MSESNKNFGPSVIVNFDDKKNPAFFVANYRHIKEKFGHLALYAMMEQAGVKEGETVPLFAQWPDAEGVRWFETSSEAKAMREVVLKNISEKTTCKDLRVGPFSVLTNRFFTECLFGEAWETSYYLHRRFRHWKARGHFRRVTLLRLREMQRVNASRLRYITVKAGRQVSLRNILFGGVQE